MKRILIILISIFINFAVSAETLEVWTVTDAINYSGDKSIYTKLVIKDEIEGTDFCPISSEWALLFDLDIYFENLEEVEIWTEQDIPDYDTANKAGLFYRAYYDDEGNLLYNSGANWLKKFVSTRSKYVGSLAFRDCKELLSVRFDAAEATSLHSFGYCWGLTEITDTCFPKLKVVGEQSFFSNKALTKISFPSVVETKNNFFQKNLVNSKKSVNFVIVKTSVLKN